MGEFVVFENAIIRTSGILSITFDTKNLQIYVAQSTGHGVTMRYDDKESLEKDKKTAQFLLNKGG